MKEFKKVNKYPRAEKAAKNIFANLKNIDNDKGRIDACKMASDIIKIIVEKKDKNRMLKNL